MQLQDIYFVAEIVGVVAVVTSLIFVGVQLRQNTNAVQVSNAQAGIDSWNEHALIIAANEDLAQAMIADTFPELAANQPGAANLRLMFWSQAGMRTVETLYLQWRSGNLPDDLWLGYRGGITACFTLMRGYNDAWGNYRTTVSPEFRSYMDGLQKEGAARRAEMAGATV